MVHTWSLDGSRCFRREESAGASFLRRDGTVWSTDKDGLILGLLARKITARTGQGSGLHYQELTNEFGTPYYTRIDAPATRAEEPAQETLSGSRHRHRTRRERSRRNSRASGNDASIGGLKVVSASGWSLRARRHGEQSTSFMPRA